MAGHSQNFPWPSYYGHYNFFAKCIRQHSRVASLIDRGNGVFEVTRTSGGILRVFICDCYAFGIAEYIETVENLGPLNAIVINSAWCGYSPDAKRHCREERVGLFKFGGFMAALNFEDYWTYLTDDEKEMFSKQWYS